MIKNYYIFYGIKLPKASNGQTFSLNEGRRRITKNKKGGKRLKKIIENWDYFATHWDKFYELTQDKYINLWCPKLKDIEYKNYPFYILDYDYELRKIVPKMKKYLKK